MVWPLVAHVHLCRAWHLHQLATSLHSTATGLQRNPAMFPRDQLTCRTRVKPNTTTLLSVSGVNLDQASVDVLRAAIILDKNLGNTVATAQRAIAKVEASAVLSWGCVLLGTLPCLIPCLSVPAFFQSMLPPVRSC